jgi:pyrimidine nucleoside transport protein
LIFTWTLKKKRIIIGLFSAGAVAYLFSDLKDYYNLVSLAGLFVFILICIFLSEHPSKINWRILIVGILIQYALGIFILRSQFGYKTFEFLGQQVSTFLDYTDSGSQLVFGSSFRDHYFAFKASLLGYLFYFIQK